MLSPFIDIFHILISNILKSHINQKLYFSNLSKLLFAIQTTKENTQTLFEVTVLE